MIPRLTIALLAMAALAPWPAAAITLDEALAVALGDTEAVREAEHSAEALRAEARARSAFTLPQVRLGGEYLRLDTNAAESPFLGFPDEDASASVEASQVLWAGGKITGSLRLSRSLAGQADLSELAARRDIKRRVRLAFYGVLYQRALLGVLRERLGQRQEELQDARDLRAAGMVTSLDIRQAELSMSRALHDLKAAEADYEGALIEFNLALGRSGALEPLVPEGRLGRAGGLGALLGAAEEALSGDALLDIRLSRGELETRRHEQRVARAENLPELALVGQAETARTITGARAESWAAGLRLSWDILDGGLGRARREAAEARLGAARDSLSRTRKELAGRLRELGVRAGSIDERIGIQERAVELSKENYADARGHYRAGTITQTRLGEFNLAYAEARFALNRLYFLELQVLAELQALVEGAQGG